MIKYRDHIAQLADSCRNYSSKQWLNYDRQFCLILMDKTQWRCFYWISVGSHDSWKLFPPFYQCAFQTLQKYKFIDCYKSGKAGHFAAAFSETPLKSGMSSIVFRAVLSHRPRENGANCKTNEPCTKWTIFQCSRGPFCQYGRCHQYKYCFSRADRQGTCPVKFTHQVNEDRKLCGSMVVLAVLIVPTKN